MVENQINYFTYVVHPEHLPSFFVLFSGPQIHGRPPSWQLVLLSMMGSLASKIIRRHAMHPRDDKIVSVPVVHKNSKEKRIEN